jgi:hypothetical protein
MPDLSYYLPAINVIGASFYWWLQEGEIFKIRGKENSRNSMFWTILLYIKKTPIKIKITCP